MQKNNFKFSTFLLAGFIILIFMLQNSIPNFTDAFKLASSDIFKRPWILLTSIFLHANMPHLLLNLFSLVLFGIILENNIGTKKYLLIFLITGFLSSFISSERTNLALAFMLSSRDLANSMSFEDFFTSPSVT